METVVYTAARGCIQMAAVDVFITPATTKHKDAKLKKQYAITNEQSGVFARI